MKLALYQPDIAQNAGAAIRLCACLGVGLDIIEPCGFPFGDRAIRRVAMDYTAHMRVERHPDWVSFTENGIPDRLILLSTKASLPYTALSYRPKDTLLVGRESAGVPEPVHSAADARVVIPMQPGLRSLNVVVAASMVLGEALRQTGGFATGQPPIPQEEQDFS